MADIKHEFWRICAEGLWNDFLTDLQAVSSRDARHRMIENNAFTGKLYRACYDEIGYVIDDRTAHSCWSYVAEPVYDPQLRSDVPPMVTGAAVSGGDTLVADTPSAGYTTVVGSWDGTKFSVVGLLSSNSQPGAGVYVLANIDDENSTNRGLPSLFLTIA